MSKEHWVTHDQLDTPLCDVFPGTMTSATARTYVIVAEKVMELPHQELEKMSYEKMNEYMDYLDEKAQEELA